MWGWGGGYTVLYHIQWKFTLFTRSVSLVVIPQLGEKPFSTHTSRCHSENKQLLQSPLASPPPPPICGHGLDHSAGGNIAPILSPACNRRLKARWWVSVANSVTVQPVKGDILLQSWVWWFVALAGLKIFAICYIIPDKKCVLCSVGYILLAVEV